MKKPKNLNRVKQTVFFLVIALIISACSNNSKDAKYVNPESNQFFRTWMLLGPIIVVDTNETVTEDIQEKAFDNEVIDVSSLTSVDALTALELKGQSFNWELYTSESDIINLDAIYNQKDHAYAYAYADVEMAEAKTILCGLGSDDAVKLWLNGKEVHKLFEGRALSKDNDLIELDFKKGSNQLLLKVQDFEYGWEFCFRPIGSEMVSELLIDFAGLGDIDQIKILMNYEPDLAIKDKNGLTALQNAKIQGRDEVVELLIKNGAKDDQEYPDLASYIDNYIQSNLKEQTPGLSVLVAKDGEILFEKGYGYADLDSRKLVDTKTKFRIGSITKQFVATGILKLQEEGKINVQDKLSKYIPEFPRGNEVSIEHLLTHTSGIYSFTNRPGFQDNVTKKVEAKTLMDSIMAWDFIFNPGDEISYNNSGYFILGEIIEIVSGKWFGDYLKDEIFTPLNMLNTGVYINETPYDDEAKGYTFEDYQYVPALDWDMSWAGGAGALYSTVEDLYTWNEAIFNGKVLSEESLKAAHTPVKLNNGEIASKMPYGYGWFIEEMRGKQVIAHSGGLHGFISFLGRVPEENLTVIALTNTTPPLDGLGPDQISNDFAEYALWKKLDPQKSYSAKTIDVTKLKDYVGRYDYGNSMVMVVTIEDNKLMAQMTGQPKDELFADAEDEFFWKGVEASIKFLRNEAGDITHAIHYQGGNELEVTKLPELKTLPINKDELEAYLGDYKFSEDFIMSLFISEENRFFLGATGQSGHELFKTDENIYQAKDIMLSIKLLPITDKTQIEFEQDAYRATLNKE